MVKYLFSSQYIF